MTETVYLLVCEKRAIRKPETGLALKDGNLNNWVPDEEGFQRRWPGNKRPNMVVRSKRYSEIASTAHRLNETQLQSGFLDWLYSADVDAPIRPQPGHEA